MTPALTLFILSLAGMIFLIIHKVMEMEKGKPLLSQEMVERGDALVVERVHAVTQATVRKTRAGVATVVQTTKSVWRVVSLHTLDFLHKKIATLIERIRRGSHRQVPAAKKESTPVSDFLKQIGHDRPSGDGQKKE